MELTVLGCSGSYGAPPMGACSGYLVREGDTNIWIDCGNGTFSTLQDHLDPAELSGVVITHSHPDHSVDFFGLHVSLHYGLGVADLPVYLPAGLEKLMSRFVHDWGNTFQWHEIEDQTCVDVGDVALRFSRTDHPPPTFAVEVTGGGRRLIYTADTGPEWNVGAFAPGADLVVSEASYLHGDRHSPIHLSARQAGTAAREAGARRLMLTHLWPTVDREKSEAEGADAFGAPVEMAVPNLTTEV